MEAFSDLRILASVVSRPALKIVEGVQLFVLSCGMDGSFQMNTCYEKIVGGGERSYYTYLNAIKFSTSSALRKSSI